MSTTASATSTYQCWFTQSESLSKN